MGAAGTPGHREGRTCHPRDAGETANHSSFRGLWRQTYRKLLAVADEHPPQLMPHDHRLAANNVLAGLAVSLGQPHQPNRQAAVPLGPTEHQPLRTKS